MVRANYISSFDSDSDANLDSKLLKPTDYENQENNDIQGGDLTKSEGVSEGDLTKNSSDKAGELRENKNDKNQNDLGEGASLRETTKAAAEKKSPQEEDEGEKGFADAAAAPVRKVTSSLLRSAWINLIPSWGLTLIWIDIHVFLGMVIGNKFFCKLGEEWLDMPGLKK